MSRFWNKMCIFTDCPSSTERTPDKIFITVPVNRVQRRQWFKAAGKSTDAIPHGKSYFCCEDHFDLQKDADNWMFYKTMGTRLIIKKSVIPRKSDGKQQNAHFTSSQRKERERRLSALSEMFQAERVLKEQFANNVMVSERETVFVIGDPDNDYSNSSDGLMALETRSSEEAPIGGEPLEDDVKIGFSLSSSGFVAMRDISVGTEPPNGTDQCVNNITIKTEIDESTNPDLHNNELYCRQMLGLPQKERYIIHILEASLPVPLANILIVLKKIKTGYDFQQLGYDFRKTEHGTSWAFYTTLPVIANRMKEAIFFPKEETTFGDNFENLHSVVDDFEIRIESQPAKTTAVVEFLVSCTLTGFVNFVSRGFSSSIIKEDIFRNSGFVDVVPENSVVVVDKASKCISPLLEKKNVRVVCPSHSLKVEAQDLEYSKMLLSFRLNSERLFRKIRDFQIFSHHSVVEKELILHLDDILVTICGIINLKEP